jgi:glycosyltransferase involved in cell wall biosynthesis
MARFVFATIDPLAVPAGEEFVAVARHLVGRGHHAVVVHRDTGIPATSDGVRFVRWASDGANGAADGRLMGRLIRELRPDCIAGRRAALNWSMVLGRLFGVPVRIAWDDTVQDANVFDAGRLSLRQRALFRRRSFVYRCATRIIAASHASVERMGVWFGVRPERCEVLGYGVRAPADAAARRCAPAGRVVAVGRLVPSKNHALLVRAIAKLPHDLREGLTVQIIGDGTQRPVLAALIADLGVGDVVELTGAMDNRSARAAVSSASVFVHTSVFDNLPFAIIEASAEGIPVVATRVGGIPEIIDDGVNGLLVDEGDVDGLAAALERIVRDDALRTMLGANARARFFERYEMEGWASRVADLLAGDVALRIGSDA